uniref:Golgi associated RAB2 interactor protein-like Rab2B-binding domain-containing protein n=1 Tax=Pelusios castaneus TaxID=367368 RepID=A0A8C8VEP2_9SAUR
MRSYFSFRSLGACSASRSQISIMGDLQRVLGKGEYAPFTSAPMFESNFVQVNRRGEPIYVHNRPNCVTVGICASNPSLSLPNVMLLAHTVPPFPQEAMSKRPCKELFSYRFFPLEFVEISVHNAEKHRLKLKLVSGRSFYLELCAPPDKQHLLFRQWLRLISLLKLPQNHYNNTQVNVVYENFNGQQVEGTQATRNQSEKVSLWQFVDNTGVTWQKEAHEKMRDTWSVLSAACLAP